MSESKPDVLVIGGGPVGLTMACELLRHGVRCRIVDQNAAPQKWSKAAAVSARTMEVFHDMGIVNRALERGRPMYGANMYKGTERIAHIDIHVPGTPYPYLFGMSQRHTELMLAERFVELGGTFEREVTLETFRQDDEGVIATLTRKDGTKEEVHTPYLVGCDGAHSTVRKALDLAFEGSTFEQTIIQTDIRVDFPFDVDPREAVMFISDNGPIGMLPLLDDGRYRLLAFGVEDPPEEPPLELFEELVQQRCPEGVTIHDPAWTVSFRFHGRIVPAYSAGRVFLAGDAAHIHSPAGGQGMNLGIQDAYNLAWKLGLVLRGACKPGLLDSYNAERWPVGRNTVDVTDAATKRAVRMMTLRSPLAQALRNQAISFVVNSGIFQERAFESIGQLTVAYAASPIVGEHHSSIWTTEIGLKRTNERPRPGDWYNFGKGPGPGERVSNLDMASGQSLIDLLCGTRHVLLLFDGAAATAEGYDNLTAIAERVRRRYGDYIDVHVVVPCAQAPSELNWDGTVELDGDSSLHEHFGCGSEALYLIRPDGHVAFRTQPAEESHLLRYLETIFID
jgi:2-polyprenyl-6-methoxyphenol hydroxylase-like FAD-dependent oxidoreductase